MISPGRRGATSHLLSFSVAHPQIYRGFAWQACTCGTDGALGLGLGVCDASDTAPLLRGRRGTNSHLPFFHVAGVAQPHIYRPFAGQAWHLWHRVARLDLVEARVTPVTPRHFCVAGVAQTLRPFTWQAWHNLTSTVGLRGRRGTYCTGWRASTWFRCT